MPPVLPLSHEDTISAIFTSGHRLVHPLFDLRYLPNTHSPAHTTLALIASRRAFRHAITRNRLKRQIRAALQPHLPHLIPGWNVLIILKTPLLTASFINIKDSIHQQLKKAKIRD